MRAGPSRRSPGASRRSRYSSRAMLSSMPGVSNHSSTGRPSSRRRAPSTWRVVPGLSATWPNALSRVSVRSNEVLPVLVWPTTATFNMDSVIAGLQPAQRLVGIAQNVGRRHAGGCQALAPGVQARGGRAVLGLAGGQPDARPASLAGQRGDERQRAAIGRLARVAGDQQASRAGLGQRIEQPIALLARIEV